MELYKKIENDMKEALKAGDSARLSVLRMVISAVKMLEIENNKRPIDTDIVQILRKQIKQRRESVEQFKAGNRQDLADKEATEIKIIEKYMPEQMQGRELEDLVKAVISELGASSKRETGRVMKVVMEKAQGRCDGKSVNEILMKFLK